MEYQWAWLVKPEIPTMVQVLVYLSDVRTVRTAKILNAKSHEAPTSELDSTSSIRWTCMSTIVMSRILQTFDEVGTAADRVIKSLAEVRGATEGSNDDNAAKTARTIDGYLKESWRLADSLHQELRDVDQDNVEDRVRTIMQDKDLKANITALDDAWNGCGWAQETDKAIIKLTQALREATGGVLDRFHGAVLPWKQVPRLQFEKGTQPALSYFIPQFIPPRLLIQRLWSCVSTLRGISSTGWVGTKPADLYAPELAMLEMRNFMDEARTPMETQLWRLQDLRSGGLVYSLELFIHAIKSSGKAALPDSSRELYRNTFLVIARRWSKGYKYGIWTERLMVDLLRRVLPPVNVDLTSDQVPDYLINEFLTFLADVLEKKKGPHVDDAISQIKEFKAYCERFDYSTVVAGKALLKLESARV